MEVERKFLVRQIPKDLHKFDNFNINQYYLSYSPEVRIRAIDDKRYLTIKSNDNLARKEVEIEISKYNYEDLKEMAASKVICKTRFEVLDNGFTCELDIYHSIAGLMVVEVEFDSKELSDQFIKPEWFGDEITYIEEFKNRNLAKHGYPYELKCFGCGGIGMINVDDGYGMRPREVCEHCKGKGKLKIEDLHLDNYNTYLKFK